MAGRIGRRPRGRRPGVGVGVGVGGFTLLELLVGLVLIAYVASISVPAYFDRPEVTLEKAAILLARDLRSAQNRAAYLGEPVQFTFDPQRPGYRVWSPGRSQEEDPSSYDRRYDRDAVFEGVALSASGFGSDGTLVFDASGHARDPGSVTLRYGSDVRILEVEAPTGRLVLRNTSSGWRDRGFEP